MFRKTLPLNDPPGQGCKIVSFPSLKRNEAKPDLLTFLLDAFTELIENVPPDLSLKEDFERRKAATKAKRIDFPFGGAK